MLLIDEWEKSLDLDLLYVHKMATIQEIQIETVEHAHVRACLICHTLLACK